MASIGTRTQDLKFRGEKTFVKIGSNCQIREFVTINSSCEENSVVSVGDNCLIMAYCHMAHNCSVGNKVIMSNNATLAGHVTVDDCAIIGGLTPIHQFVRMGRYAMVGGLSRVTHDIPPYTIGAGIPFKFGGLNIIGLKRHGFPLKVRRELAKVFKLLYRSKLPSLKPSKKSKPKWNTSPKSSIGSISAANQSEDSWACKGARSKKMRARFSTKRNKTMKVVYFGTPQFAAMCCNISSTTA